MEGNILSRDDKCGRMLLYIKEGVCNFSFYQAVWLLMMFKVVLSNMW